MLPSLGQIARNIAGRVTRHPDGVRFGRPLVLLQSDDWGRVGIRDGEGWAELAAAGLSLGEKPYDFYSLETAGDVAALHRVLKRHKDSEARTARLVMNFCVANLDFEKIRDSKFQTLFLKPLADGLPGEWSRPGLVDAYRQGIAEGVFYPALHAAKHFCRPAMERYITDLGSRGTLLRTLLRAHTPYIHWRMPWVGFEYWDPEGTPEFLAAPVQGALVREAATGFADLFGTPVLSACAPGYRANDDTRRAWAECGVRVAQDGPALIPPRFDDLGLLHTYRTVEFEPALDPARYTLPHLLERAARCFARGLPAVVSVHSINFHSTLRDFRSTTLRLLDEFLSLLESKYDNLLYLHDLELYDLLVRRDSPPEVSLSPEVNPPARAIGGAR